MVRVNKQNEKELYQCEECGFHYADDSTSLTTGKEWAEKCEAWCREHKSCNIEIAAHAEENRPKKVLFVCAENAGRSQMAEAFFNFYAKGSGWVAKSSGTIPAQKINPVAVEVMKERGIDISGASPKKFDPENINQYERVISFGCLVNPHTCFSNARSATRSATAKTGVGVKEAFSKEVQDKIEDWTVDDPRDKPMAEVRKIRNEIENRIKGLFQSLSRQSS